MTGDYKACHAHDVDARKIMMLTDTISSLVEKVGLLQSANKRLTERLEILEENGKD
jgi:hypothetical protein